MKRFLTLALLFCLILNGLFAQKKPKNKAQSSLAIETGVPIFKKEGQTFPIPLNLEFQKIKKRWGLGVALGLAYDTYLYGDCNRRVETGSYAEPEHSSVFSGGFVGVYCENRHLLNVKPSIFSSYYFFQSKKVNLFVKMGLTVNILGLYRRTSESFQVDPQPDSLGRYKVLNGDPIHSVQNGHLWHFNNVDLMSGLGMNYTINKQTSLRFALQSEVNIPFQTQSLYPEKTVLVSMLCGLSFKI
jgi:hypothetical protein